MTAANYLAKNLKHERLLTFDMGGISTDVALIDGRIELSGDGRIAGYPVAVPMVNIYTVDAGDLLQLGPRSAGASPGPACYGQGGQFATRLGLESAEAAAEGIIRIANEHMAQALRVISVDRGIDPRGFAINGLWWRWGLACL